jgi:hypothetical protein
LSTMCDGAMKVLRNGGFDRIIATTEYNSV